MKDLYSSGKGSLLAWISAAGFDSDAYVSLMDYELECDFENKYPVHATSYTMSNKDKDDFLLPREDEWYDWRGIHQMDGRFEGLVDKFVTEPNLYYHGWLLYVWAHTYEFEEFGTWDRIDGILKRIAACGDVWFATNSEIYDYVKAFRGLVWYADASAAYNPAPVDVFLRCDNGEFRVPAGGETKVTG